LKKPETTDVLNRLDEAYACWEEGMWRTRIRRRVFQLANPNYQPRITEVGFPVDGANEAKQLILETASRNSLDYLLPSIHSQISVSVRWENLKQAPRIKDLFDSNQRIEAFTDEMEASIKWEEYHFPYYLGKWNASSRRVYYVPTDLMLLLEATKLDGLTFRGARLPFQSFALAFETPLVNEYGKELDFFLIGECSTRSISTYGFARSLSNVKLISPFLRAEISAAAKKGNVRRLIAISKRELDKTSLIADHWDSFVDEFDPSEGLNMDQDLEEALSEMRDNWCYRLFRVLSGLSAYMITLNGSYPEVIHTM